MVKYGTIEYYKELADALNKDEEFTKSGISTTYIYRFTDLKNASGENLSFFIKFEKGKVAEIKEVSANEDAEFIGTADYATMSKITKGELDGQEAINSGTLKFKFFMLKAIRYGNTLKRISKVAQTLHVEY